MRAVLIILGLLLLAGGVWVVFGNGSYQTTDTLLQIGSAKITATHDKAIPSWIGMASMAVGALMALGGFLKKG
ncbi:hypothetical protein [Dyella silvae]|uniref:hypothetical protein n=1 Tax=Dyella silvae TaxID=2994424 RepID=UPI002265502D|nr:hypothetical protein [Dyella silvae]